MLIKSWSAIAQYQKVSFWCCPPQVNSIIRFKRKVLQEVPSFEERGKAAAALAVVQEYLLASVRHLEGQQPDNAASICAVAAEPSWDGTAHVQRPSAMWDMYVVGSGLVG